MDPAQAAQAELDNLSTTGETATGTPEMYELPVGGQTYRFPVNTEFPVKHNGQVQQVALEKILNAYRQQAHVEDKFKDLNTQRDAFKTQLGDAEAYKQWETDYKPFQDWSIANPNDWARLKGLYDNREMNLGEDSKQNELMQKQEERIAGLEQQLTKYVDTQETDAAMKEMATEKEELLKLYPHIDLGEKDLDGLTLESRIVQSGLDAGLPTFKSAYLSYPGMVERLLETATHQSRNDTVKSIQQDNKDGIVARSATPFPAQGQEVDTRRLSEDERRSSALSELEGLMGE